jgi:hypothetical protein
MPERDAPTIPKATTYLGYSLFPEKNVLLSPLPFVKLDTINNKEKYDSITTTISDSDISFI